MVRRGQTDVGPDFAVLFAALPTACLVLDRDLVIVEMNPAYLELTGRTRDEILGTPVFEAFPPPADALGADGVPEVEVVLRRTRDERTVEVMPLHKYDVLDTETGIVRERYWSTTTVPLLGADGETAFLLQRVDDVTDFVVDRARAFTPVLGDHGDLAGRIRAAEAELYLRAQQLLRSQLAEDAATEALSSSQAQAQAVLDTAVDAILTFRDGVVVSMNRAAEQMFEVTAQEAVGDPMSVLVPDLGARQAPSEKASAFVLHPEVETYGCRRSGAQFPIEVAVSEVGAGSGLFTAIARDVSDRKALEEQLAYQSTHDPLTGLANRALFRDRLDHAVARLARHPGTLAVLFVDLDRFKEVNDRWGHTAGDELLMITAQRLQAAVRGEDLVARFGGDEFVVLCEELTDVTDARSISARFSAILAEPVRLPSGVELAPSASVGAIVDSGRRTADQLLRAADAEMYLAKRNRDNRSR